MPRQIPLPVPLDVEPSRHAPALDRCFPDGGVDDLSSPLDVAWQADIYREQPRHRADLRSREALPPTPIIPRLIRRQIESAKPRPDFIVTKGPGELALCPDR